MKNHHHSHPIHPKAPSHEVIAERAFRLWTEQGKPESCDEANWLEAETQLSNEKTGSPAPVRSGKTAESRATS